MYKYQLFVTVYSDCGGETTLIGEETSGTPAYDAYSTCVQFARAQRYYLDTRVMLFKDGKPIETFESWGDWR